MIRNLKWMTAHILLVITIGLNASNFLNVHEKSRANTIFDTNLVQKLTFASGDIVITKKDATISTFNSTNVAYMNFTSNALTSIETSNSANNLIVYPNPAKDFLTVEVPNLSVQSKIEFIGIDGKVVLCCKLINFKTSISISVLPKGLYVCRYNNGKDIVNSKFIKQ